MLYRRSWVFGNELTDSINEPPFEAERRVLSAVGWNAKYITAEKDKNGGFINTDALQIRKDIISAIDKGFPVLIRHIDRADCNLNVYFGYENDGQKIIGYNYNNGFEAGASLATDNGVPVTWDNWEENVSGYILLQGKKETATERAAALTAFQNIVDHARKTAEVKEKKLDLLHGSHFYII